jgi:CRISPR type III-B/RAMP module-associated protein Cmr3
MPAYTITPEDILFFRDGRPMETAGGHGARWPEPSVIFDALHAALHRAFPDAQDWEHSHRYGRSSDRDMSRARTQRFGSLATAGPFPAWKDGRWLFPAPADATTSLDQSTWLLKPIDQLDRSDLSNLPAPLRYPVASFTPPTKDTPPPWWSARAWQAYLAGTLPDRAEQFTDDDLFAREWHTGIAIDPATGTTGHGQAEGKIYAAQYLRLRDGVTLGIHATMPMKNGQPDQRQERISQLFPANRTLIVGGQQRVCLVEEILDAGQSVPLAKLLPVSPPITGTRVKWVLLSPAVFPAIAGDTAKGITAHPGGWLPNWICPNTGEVRLKAGDTERQPGESREAWRKRVREAPFLNCRLVAAVIPKPIPITGWTERLHLLAAEREIWEREGAPHGPRPALLAVPAGAVYYFEADSPEAAAQLAAALNWHGADTQPTTIRNRRSTLLGEKGFGLGVCGTWQFYRPDLSDRSHPSDPSR